MSAHSHLSASSAERWFNCPGSVSLCKQVPPLPNTSYSLEGTEAHSMLEDWLQNFYQNNIAPKPDVNVDMENAVDIAYKYITGIFPKNDGKILLEHRFDLSFVHKGMFGTSDFTGYKDGTLYVIDYKHGKGVPVDAYKNKQLMYYALGAINYFKPKRSEIVKMVIIQPRCEGQDIKEFEMKVSELILWQQTLREAAILADSNNAPLKAGKHCRWCAASALCPAMANDLFPKVSTTKVSSLDKKELPVAQTLTKEQLSFIVQHKPIIEGWLEACHSFAQSLAYSGETLPGLKLVKKRTHRKWKDEENVIKELDNLGIDIYAPRKLKTPAQMEKLKLVDPSVLNSLIEVSDTSLSLVPENDKREGVAPAAPEDLF